MAEDESKQDDEKLEFTLEGETLGYISLDQARVLAMQHARDNREFYGRYADRELVWEVIAADETEDYYEVKLTYRPAGSFRGRPGVQQLTIDKTGSIEFRQVISQPVEKRRWMLLASVAVVVALVVFGAVVAATFVWGGKPSESAEAPARAAAISPQVENSKELIEVPVIEEVVLPLGENSEGFTGAPARGAWFYPITVNTPVQWSPLNGEVTLTLDAGSVDSVVGLEFDLVSEIPQLPAGFVSSGAPFDLSVQPDHDSPAIPYTFLKPLTLTFRLSGTDETLARGDESNVVVQRFKDDAWTPLPTTVDFAASIAQTQVNNLSLFILTIKEPEPTQKAEPTQTLPPTAIPTPLSPTPTPTPTSTVIPTNTPTPPPTATAIPTRTPVLAPTATPRPAPTPAPTLTPTPSPQPTPTLTPTPAPVPGRILHINGFAVPAGQIIVPVPYGEILLYQLPQPNGMYAPFASVTMQARPLLAESEITFGGVDSQSGSLASVSMNGDRYVVVLISPPVALPTPTPTPAPTVTPVPAPTLVLGADEVYTLTVNQLDTSFAGKTVSFKIGDLWANETAGWQQGGATGLNLTVSSRQSALPDYSHRGSNSDEEATSSRGRLLASPVRQQSPPHMFTGTATVDGSPAPLGTSISAWVDGELAGVTTVTFRRLPDARNATAVTFRALGDNLKIVWHFDAKNGNWLFYDPGPKFLAVSTYTDASAGDIVWVRVDLQQVFQGQTLYPGWDLISLD